MSKLRILPLVLVVSTLLGACGMGRTVLKPTLPSAPPPGAAARVFKLVSLRDARAFEARPKQANVPSLAGTDAQDHALTARAVGRKRGSFGKARGDYMLPEGSDVNSVVRACLATAVARTGGVLVDEGDPRFASAIPLEASVQRFWSWLRPGAFKVQVEFDVTMSLKADLAGFENGKTISVHAQLRRAAINDVRWAKVIDDGLTKLTDELTRELGGTQAAPPSMPVADPAPVSTSESIGGQPVQAGG